MRFKTFILIFFISNQLLSQVILEGDIRNGDLIAARVEDKLYSRDTFESRPLDLSNGLYTVVRDTLSLFDFVVFGGEVNIKFEREIAEYKDTTNKVFYKFIEKHLKNGVKLDSNWTDIYKSIVPLLRVVFPTLFPYDSQTHKGISEQYWNLSPMQYEFLKNSPFVRQYLNNFYDRMISQNYDSIYDAIENHMRFIQDLDLRQFYFSVLTNKYETSKIVGHENVFASIVLGFPKQDFNWVEDSVYDKLIAKAEKIRMNPIGALAKDFPIRSLKSGQQTKLSNIFGIYKLVVFFDSDCGHCKEAMPFYMEVIKEFRDAGLVPILITVETTNEFLQELIDSRGYPNEYFYYSHTITSDDFRIKYDIPSTPQLYILDSSNKILAKNIPAKELKDYFNFLTNN